MNYVDRVNITTEDEGNRINYECSHNARSVIITVQVENRRARFIDRIPIHIINNRTKNIDSY